MEIEQLLKNSGHDSLLELQKATISSFQSNDHLTLIAKTGSGKTLGFLLSASQYLKRESEDVQLLVLTPTRELALQVTEVFNSMRTGLKSTVCYGGHSVRDEKNALLDTPAVVIGTPGRILDHLEREHLDLSHCKMVIIDEFDKSLEYGFETEMNTIRHILPKRIRSIYVSATDINYVPKAWKHEDNVSIDFAEDGKESRLEEFAVNTGANAFETLVDCIKTFGHEQSIIFCNYREVVDDLSARMREEKVFCEAYHGGMDQIDRERALIKFANGSVSTLICTDLGARGLDIGGIKHVVHYQFPGSEAAFIHRNGRTARANADGNAYIIANDSQQLPDYIDLPKKTFRPDPHAEAVAPKWVTLYFSAGKKEKIRKVDIVGFLSQQGKLKQDEIGKIDLMDHMCFVAVSNAKYQSMMKNIRNEKIKGKKVKISKSK